MAYNPFDFFRKNQKIFFAVLTIVVMFMFVLSFGQGDFFSWFPQWLSAQRSTGDVMAKVGGSSVRESDLSRINSRRLLANQFMNGAAQKQLEILGQKVSGVLSGTNKVSEENQMVILRPYLMLMNLTQQRLSAADWPFIQKALVQSQGELAALANKPGIRAEDKQAADDMGKLINAQMRAISQGMAGGPRSESIVYFANMPNRSMKDQLEFMLWLKKADQLGIRFTPEGVKQLVDVEFPDVKQETLDALAADAAASSARRRTESDLYDALADEFRVRAAQTAVLGTPEVRSASGAVPPIPYDYFDFYRRETSPTQYAFVTLPVEPFTSLVTGEPTEQELKRIFVEAKGIDPDPSSPKPGIREPRKIKVQWAEVTGQEAFYDAKTDEKMKALLSARKIAETSGAGAILGVAATHPAAFGNTRYDQYKQEQLNITRLWERSSSNPGLPAVNLLPIAGVVGGVLEADTALVERLVTKRSFGAPRGDASAKLTDATLASPQNAGSLAGLLGGSFGTAGSLMTAPTILTQSAYTSEQEQRLIVGLQGLIFPTLPTAAVVDSLGAEVSVFAGLPQPLPQARVQPILDQVTKNELRYKVATEDVQAFEKKLAETMKQDDKTAAAKQAAEMTAAFIKERGLKAGGSTQLHDIHSIANDPGLSVLIPKSKMADQLLGTLTNSLRKSAFGFTLFRQPLPPRSEAERFNTQYGPPAVGLYAPTPYPPSFGESAVVSEDKPLLLTWRTEETKVESPREFNDPVVQAKCLQIWKRNKARELARKAADELLAEVKKGGESGPVVSLKLQDALAALQSKFPNPVDKNQFRLIDKREYNVAELVPDVSSEFPRPGFASPLRPFDLPFGDDFVYPTPKMREELLANRDKPVGTGLVLTDLPETTVYAAVVTSKDQASPLAFRNMIYSAGRSPFGGGPQEMVEARYATDSRKDAREQAVALLKAEFGYTDENPELEKKAKEMSEF